MTTTTTQTAPLPACPSWCTIAPGHDWEGEFSDGRLIRCHEGPKFGEHVSAGSEESSRTPGVQFLNIYVSDSVIQDTLDAGQALSLARNLIDAAQWLIGTASEARA